MRMDETLYALAERVKNFAAIYLVDITEVPDFNKVIGSKDYACLASDFAKRITIDV